jgi:hypothetical protein
MEKTLIIGGVVIDGTGGSPNDKGAILIDFDLVKLQLRFPDAKETVCGRH